MIRFDDVTFTYPERSTPTLRNVDLLIPEGELVLVVGETGSGKSTLLRAVNGLVPHFTGGQMSGHVSVAGLDTRELPPRELAEVVGLVAQNPRDGFVADVVEDEIAYGMETIGLPADIMRRRVEESLDLLGLAEVRTRPLRSLSGGQQQRTAIAALLAQHPSAMVLDEPTSALDPSAAEDVLAALQRIVHDLGVTVLLAEHRLERVVQFADRVVVMHDDGTVKIGDPEEMLASTTVAPPVVSLGRLVGWNPLPLSVRQARRLADPLRQKLATVTPLPSRSHNAPAPDVIDIRKATARYAETTALREVSVRIGPGEVVAVMGRNGAGKSTLLRTLVGLMPVTAGSVRVGNEDPRALRPDQLVTRVGMVPQEPADLLWTTSVADECAAADTDHQLPEGATAELLERLTPGIDPNRHPRDLSEGQRLALALAVILIADAPVLLLDEPTRGLDYPSKSRLVSFLKQRAAAGHAVVIATHDVEFAAEVATRTIVMADGDIVADGPTNEVVVGSPQFAPQVAKVLSPLPWLTVDEVASSLAVVGP
jgi:energy-coupling factor transport system ATP-binding protein